MNHMLTLQGPRVAQGPPGEQPWSRSIRVGKGSCGQVAYLAFPPLDKEASGRKWKLDSSNQLELRDVSWLHAGAAGRALGRAVQLSQVPLAFDISEEGALRSARGPATPARNGVMG